MRPDKSVVIVYLNDSLLDVHSLIISKSICGRLVLRAGLIDTILSQNENSAFLSDCEIQGTQILPEDLTGFIQNSEVKVIYLILNSDERINEVLELCEKNKYWFSMILSTLYQIPEPKHEMTPKQSYMFDDYEEIKSEFLGSVFYCDYEIGYSRRDWLVSIDEVQSVGGNGLILAEKHHLEILTRLGLKHKYGS